MHGQSKQTFVTHDLSYLLPPAYRSLSLSSLPSFAAISSLPLSVNGSGTTGKRFRWYDTGVASGVSGFQDEAAISGEEKEPNERSESIDQSRREPSGTSTVAAK